MIRSHVIQPRAVAALVRSLIAFDVTLPANVVDAATVLDDAVSGELTRAALQPAAPVDWLAITRPDLVRRIRDHATLRLITDRLVESAVSIADQVAEAAVASLRDSADPIIQQLRTRFDPPAKALHEATQLGLRSGITADAVLHLGPDAIEAWRELSGHVAALDAIARVRLALTDVADVEPLGDPSEQGRRLYGACFSTDSPRWDGDDHTDIGKWLRLSGQAEPLTLLDTAATRKAARDNRVERPYIAPDFVNPDARIDTPRPRTFVGR